MKISELVKAGSERKMEIVHCCSSKMNANKWNAIVFPAISPEKKKRIWLKVCVCFRIFVLQMYRRLIAEQLQ